MPSLIMPLYVNHDDVVLRMQVNGDLAGVKDVIDSAIIGAQIQVQALTQSKLEVTAQDSVFQLDSGAFSGIQPGGVFRLELASGFIRSDSPVLVTFDSRWNLPDPTTADPVTYKVDLKRGYVLMDARIYADKFVRVQCSTGFAVLPVPTYTGTPAAYDSLTAYTVGNAVSFGGKVYVATDSSTGATPVVAGVVSSHWTVVVLTPEQLPTEVYEAIMSYVAVVFDSSQTTNRNQEEEPQAKKAFDRAQLILGPYLRMKGFSFRPMWA